ncbi:MAG: 3-isopropylmalate dehydratase small subunit [Candidatus Omnitrophica bacterium]|nr:3-isopropylmalate dehydratase small subunit [Candidatus Omnitrophota bacterium]
MTPFKSHRGLLATLDRANVDTDQIIPKQFLKSIARTGFGPHLFHDWRYLPDGSPNPEFPLNQPRFKGASILVVRNNFGCGSSREHAVWAIRQDGFEAVIAPWRERAGNRVPAFADIFRTNSAKNALLTVELSEPEVEKIFQMADRYPGLEATVDLDRQRVTLHLSEEISFHFEIDPSIKERLLHGLDDIGLTLMHEAEIRAFESRHDPQLFRPAPPPA